MVINVAMSIPTVCLYEFKFYYVFSHFCVNISESNRSSSVFGGQQKSVSFAGGVGGTALTAVNYAQIK